MRRIERRDLIKGAAGFATLALASPAIIATASAAELKATLVSLYALSGTFAADGTPGVTGAKIAIKYLAPGYGQNIDYVSVDSEGNPGNAVTKTLAEIDQHHRGLFFGGVLSSVALAVGSQINKANGIFTTAVGADEVTGVDCNRATFRWSVPTYGAIQETVRPVVEKFPNAKRWYTITPKYVFGESLLRNAKDVFKEKGIELVGNSYHSLSATEFSGYLTNALAAKPDVLLLLNFGTQATNCLRQAVNFGMKKKMKILMVWAAGLDQYETIGADVLEGVYVGCQYDMAIKSPGNKKILELYKRAGGRPPGYVSVSGYICSDLIMLAMKKAGSAEPAAIIKALEGMQYEGPTGEETV
ncbi:MAG: ABC transporter substrate-binding protein, partial [Acetobacteraceae bacterium]